VRTISHVPAGDHAAGVVEKVRRVAALTAPASVGPDITVSVTLAVFSSHGLLGRHLLPYGPLHGKRHSPAAALGDGLLGIEADADMLLAPLAFISSGSPACSSLAE
jgi:hypothetical protein